jgi:hypothetical protein
MTPREERELIVSAIINDIMENMEENDLGIIRDALESHFARYRWAEIEQEYKERAGA